MSKRTPREEGGSRDVKGSSGQGGGLCLRGHQGRIPGCPRDPPNWVGACVWGDTKAELPTSWHANEWDIPKKWVRWRSPSARHAYWNKHCEKRKHTQNVMATIFSSGCYAPYIYTIIATPLHFLRLPLSSIFCFILALGLYTIVHCRISVCSCTWCWLPRLCLRGHQGRILGCPRDPPNRVGACVWGDTKGSSGQHEGLCLRGHQGRIPASCNWGQHWGSLNCNVKKM